VVLKKKGFLINESSIVQYDRFNPEGYAEILGDKLKEIRVKKVFIDISGMSKLAIILSLDMCKELNLDVSLFYAEALEYGPSQKCFDKAKQNKKLPQPSIQVYTGIHGVIRVARLSSVAMQGQPTAVITFMSFNESMTQVLLDTICPSRLFLINGRPPELRWREEATAWIHEQLRKEWPDKDNPINLTGKNKGLPKMVTSTFDYRQTLKVLLDLYWSLAVDHRILLAPTGSKLQSVGCFFGKALHPDIHIEYPTPTGFLDLYSTGIGKMWLIRLGKLGERIDKIRKRDRRIHLNPS
jgi:hypothetical protein